MGRGVDIPCVGDLIYHGYGCQSAMGRGVDMTRVGRRYTMGRGSIYNG